MITRTIPLFALPIALLVGCDGGATLAPAGELAVRQDAVAALGANSQGLYRSTDTVQPLEPETLGPVSASLAGAAPRLPHATYAKTINPEDIPPFFPAELIDLIIGDYEMDLTDPRAYTIRRNGDVVVVGQYTATPARLAMRDLDGPYACLDEPGTAHAVYGWSLDEDALTTEIVQEPCGGRAFVMTVSPWLKQ